jgi:hypothetical protein
MADHTYTVKQALRAAGWRHERPGKGDHEVWVIRLPGSTLRLMGRSSRATRRMRS